jgi:uncharacterized membrane protein YhaH (DUF805 family)
MNESPVSPSGAPRRFQILRLWFGVTQRVDQRAYALSGFGLMLVKYAVEAAICQLATGQLFTPLDFLNPSTSGRRALLGVGHEWIGWFMFLWSLPYLWIAVSMSVRRAIDAGASPWIGLLVLIPIINLLVMISLCFMASAPNTSNSLDTGRVEGQLRGMSAALAVGASIMVGALVLLVSVYAFSSYGASLFLGGPMLMGTTASYLYNRGENRSYLASVGVGFASVLFAMCAMLLFALEGGICVAMAGPLVLPIGAMGGLVGKAMADATRSSREWMAAVAILPLLTAVESLAARSPEYVVFTSVDVDASVESVWTHVIQFPELSDAKEWYFRLGIACPQRATITGRGVGAVRRCEFTTGTFVEPITTWDAPRRLAFDVSQQPDPMIELTPYRNVRPPHLNHFLHSTRGEFLLMPLAGGRTRLEGRTWYRFDMFPASYWSLWSDFFIHRIHLRVLEHIKGLAEVKSLDASSK